jgi:hypothetical protein
MLHYAMHCITVNSVVRDKNYKIHVLIIFSKTLFNELSVMTFCKIINSAEQSKHQLLVLLLKKFHMSFGSCYPLTLVRFIITVIIEKVIEYE